MSVNSPYRVSPSIYRRYRLMREPWPLLSQCLDSRWTLLGDTTSGMPHGRQVRGINDCFSCLKEVSVVLDHFVDLTSSGKGGLASEAS
jgi:hypothetical protein